MHNLLAFLTKHYHWLVFLVLEAVSGMMLFQYNSYQGSVWISSANAVAGKAYECQAALEQFLSLVSRNEQLTTNNIYLEQEVSRLRQMLYDQNVDTTELQRREMEVLDQYEWIPAKIVSNSVNQPNNLITIDKGLDDGVEPDMGVACGTGLVGVVYQSSAHYAIVIPLLNSRSRISCTVRGRNYFGYVTWNGGDPMECFVEDIPRHARFEKGDWIETSGFSAIFPAGISVGEITDILDSPDGMSYRLKVRLSTDFCTLRDVCVISDKTIAERVRLEESVRDSLEAQ